jgi:hypothetical protein
MGAVVLAHFIMDPDELLGRGGAYILDVLTWEDDEEDRWRLSFASSPPRLSDGDPRATSSPRA